jgi:hypothetical protein
VTWVEALWHVVSVLTDAGPTGLLVGAGAVAAALLGTVIAAGARLGRRPATAGPHLTRRALQERTRRTGVPRHRDPDASGRVRPRGPTGLLAAA